MTNTPNLLLANCFLTVDDPEAALAFYRDVLGLTVTTDVSNGGYRWLSLAMSGQPGLEIVLNQVGSAGEPDADRQAIADLLANGRLGGLIFQVDDVDATFTHVQASGARVLQEPTDQFYGVRDCAFRDPAGNMVRFKAPLPAAG